MQKQTSEGVRVGWGGQGGLERRIEVIVKMKKSQGVLGGGGGGGWKVSVECGCEIEVIVKMKKKSRGRSGQG